MATPKLFLPGMRNFEKKIREKERKKGEEEAAKWLASITNKQGPPSNTSPRPNPGPLDPPSNTSPPPNTGPPSNTSPPAITDGVQYHMAPVAAEFPYQATEIPWGNMIEPPYQTTYEYINGMGATPKVKKPRVDVHVPVYVPGSTESRRVKVKQPPHPQPTKSAIRKQNVVMSKRVSFENDTAPPPTKSQAPAPARAKATVKKAIKPVKAVVEEEDDNLSYVDDNIDVLLKRGQKIRERREIAELEAKLKQMKRTALK